MGEPRKDIDFSGLFRKLGHSLEEIRVRALENILSKLEHRLICEADIVHEKHLHIRLLEWFNFPECTHKAEVLSFINKLAQHSAGSQLLQDIGGVEFLSQLRADLEPCHRPLIDQILESIMLLPDADEVKEHAPECIYHKPADSGVWGTTMSSAIDGSRSHTSQVSDPYGARISSSVERLNQYSHARPGYFALSLDQDPPTCSKSEAERLNTSSRNLFLAAETAENSEGLFRLSTFPWLPLTRTDQHVMASTNRSLQTRDPGMLVGACEFLADVVFQDFPAEIFLQRPDILKSLLCLVSLPNPSDDPAVIQSCKTLACFIQCLEARIRYFQDPVMYTSKQDFSSSSPSLASSSNLSSGSHVTSSSAQSQNIAGWGSRRHRGDGQDGDSSASTSRNSSTRLEPDFQDTDDDLDLEDGPRLQHLQLSLPQLCVAVLQRSLPRLRTVNRTMGVQVLELVHETATVLVSVVGPGVWADRREMAREIVDRLTDCLEVIAELLEFHHHNQHAASPTDVSLEALTTHRVLYMGLTTTLTKLLAVIPLENINMVLPEKLKSSLHTVAYDEPLAVVYPRCRGVVLSVTESLGFSVPVDFQMALDICRSLTKTCVFCLRCEEMVKVEELAAFAEEAVQSLNYHLHMPFVSHFIQFMSAVCSKKKMEKSIVNQCTNVLLKLMAYPIDSVRQNCYTKILDIIKKCLQVQHATVPKSKESLKCKFLINSNVLYELVCFGMADHNSKVRTCATDLIHHLLKSQLLMSEFLWQELMLALLKSLPVLQSYTDQSTMIGRCLWSMLDPTTTTHNLSLVEKLRGSLRLLYLSDKKLRSDAAKNVKWFLSNEQDSETKLPSSHELDLSIISSSFILTSPAMDEDCSRSVFTVEGMKQVYDIFTSSPVDLAVKRAAGDQLAIILRDPHLHASFKELGGVEVVCSTIQKAVRKSDNSQSQAHVVPYLPACLSILRILAHHDYSLRHTLARDSSLYYSLVRVTLLHQTEAQIKSDVSHLLTLFLFDEVAKFDVGSGEADRPGTRFSLPAQVIQRYRLPFKPACHHLKSPNAVSLPEASSDIMTTSGPKEMMKYAWNISWHGGLEQLLSASKTGHFLDTSKDFSPILAMTNVEYAVLEVSCLWWNLRSNIEAIKCASSHRAVITAIDHIQAYLGALRIPAVSEFLVNNDWYSVLERFLTVNPTSSSDQSLLLHVLNFISSALHCTRSINPGVTGPSAALAWLADRLYRPDGLLVSLMNQLPSGEIGGGVGLAATATNVKRSLDKEIIRCVSAINLCLPYQLCRRARPGQMRGHFVKKFQQGLNITDAPHFYNLASLEGVLSCLMHITARPGWSKECLDMDSAGLCDQLVNSLLEVVWSFHVGRGGMSQSYMGKGVTKFATLCLLHVAYEMIKYSDDQDWTKQWLYSRPGRQDNTEQGLDWLLTLWAYRDPEVRAAGLGIAVSLTSTEAGRLLVAANCKHILGGIWGAAFSILLDSSECSLVRQQAALLLVNLLSQTMSSGDLETRSGTWQGPLVTDVEYQVVIGGIDALVALLDHTNFYAVVADLLPFLYTSSLIRPFLAPTEVPQMMDSSANTILSATDNSSLERSGQTALTTVSSLPADSHAKVTDGSQASSVDRGKGDAFSSRESTLSSSTSTETARNMEGLMKEATFPQQLVVGRYTSNGENVVTPGLISAVVKLLTNLASLTPQTCQENMKKHSIIESLLRLINHGRIQTLCGEMASGRSGCVSAVVLQDILCLYESIAELLTVCATQDTNSRIALLGNTVGLKSLATLLLLQWQDMDDIGNVCASLSVSILRLLSSLLQSKGSAALKTLTEVLGQIWSPLTESLCTVLADRNSDRIARCSTALDFLALLFCEERSSLVKNPDRVSSVATISELLDAPLLDDKQELSLEGRTTGRNFCKALVNIFDTVLSPSKDEKIRSAGLRLKVMSALKSLLAVSQSAKQCALEAGLAESIIEHTKQTHAQLNLETLGMIRSGTKKEEPLLQELVIVFDFLRNFMYGNADVKVACYHSGLTVVVHGLWAWCQQEASLMSSVLSLLTTFSANCSSAASSITSTMSALVVSKPGAQGSLLHYILKLAQKELDRDECSPTLRLVFVLLTNLTISQDCRNVLWKNPFLNQFSLLNPRKKRGKVRAAVEVLWCELLLALSFSVDGQQIILKIPDSLTVLMDMMEAGSTRCQQCATLIIRNLCCHATNKPKLLAADKLISVLLNQIKNRTDERTQLVATSALWALVYNNHKARVQVKSANVAPFLADILHTLQSSEPRSQVTSSTCENLMTVIQAVRD